MAGAVDRDGANAFLAEFLPRCNARFAVPHADPVPAWRPVPAEVRLERVFVFKYPCKVARDHTVRIAGRVLQASRSGWNHQSYRVPLLARRPHNSLDRPAAKPAAVNLRPRTAMPNGGGYPTLMRSDKRGVQSALVSCGPRI
ncbi:MAG: hypothetical protein WKF78_07630 [Candidatus Limnocylindrales bacterium]